MVIREELTGLEREIKTVCELCLRLATLVRTEYKPVTAHSTGGSGHKSEHPSILIMGSAHEALNLGAALKAHDFETRVTDSKEEAVNFMSNGVRLVIIDEGSFENADVGWQLRQYKPIPIVLLGSYHDNEGWQKAVALEADDYLRKSMTEAEQIARVKAILRRHD